MFDLGDRQWDIAALRRLLGTVVETGTSFEDFEVEHEFPSIGTRTMLVNARRIRPDTAPPWTILLAVEDITARRRTERDLRAS
jgi:hypothetical protein